MTLASQPHPATRYQDALARIELLDSRERVEINPTCCPQLLTQGHRVEHAIVFLHGLTSGPPQFIPLGEKFHALGYNVFIPRIPHHGMSDRLSSDLARLTAEELVAFTDQVIDIARGLGEQVTVAGLSLGGTLAGWAATERADVDRALIIAPGFAIFGVPFSFTMALGKLMRRLPNFFLWWHPLKRARYGTPYSSPRYSTHALGEMFRIVEYIEKKSRVEKPRARSIVIVNNRHDPAVSNRVTNAIALNWILHGANVRTFEFKRELPWLHDIITMGQKGQRIDIVYPKLIELMNER